MPINGISNVRRLPREGKIRLGKKVKKGNAEYPIQTPYFILEDERLTALYGLEPTELDIMFPVNDVEVIFPQYYKNYGKTGLKCKGDGQTAMYMDRGQLIEKTCTPGAKECAGCKPVATLNFLLYKVPGMGTWQINTSSWNSIVNLNSCIDMIRAMTGGRIAFIPLKLSLVSHNATVRKADGSQFQKQVYVLMLTIDKTMEEFYNAYAPIDLADHPVMQHFNDVQQKMNAITARHTPAISAPTTPQIEIESEDDEDFVEENETAPRPAQPQPAQQTLNGTNKVPKASKKAITGAQKEAITKLKTKNSVPDNEFWAIVGSLGYEHIEDMTYEVAGELIQQLGNWGK